MKKDLLKIILLILIIFIPVGIVGAISETGNTIALTISIIFIAFFYAPLMATIGIDWIADKLDL